MLILLSVVGVLVLGYFVWTYWPKGETPPPPIVGDGRPATFLFCSWNVENLFDDADDARNRDDMEDWFGTDPAAFQSKLDRLAEGLLKMNGGVGPDVACLVEVESERAATALMDKVNSRLEATGYGDRKYTHVLFKESVTDRRTAPAILTRLGVNADRTGKIGNPSRNGRILEGHLHYNGHKLVVIAAHWTSRLTDGKEDAHRRLSYANDCYTRVRAILHENPDADVIVCGDFNDQYRDQSMRVGLKATNDPYVVGYSLEEPRVLALFANWARDREPTGTVFNRDHGGWAVFDHICVTRGLLNPGGWSCDPASAMVFAPDEFRFQSRDREPFRYGGPSTKERGFSDHFPVTTQLNVAGAADP
jgi:endonuclease/exonuclease/phosphatase family metal-dependent hydrolase